MFAAEIRRKRINRMRSYSNWQWHLDEVVVKINGEIHYFWRAVDHEGEVLETGLHITATASRPETSDWCLKLGAHQIVNYRNLIEKCKNSGIEDFEYIVQFADLAQHWDAMCELVAPQGKIGTIVETDENLNISALQGKSASLHWELMFTRSIYQTDDMYKQGKFLHGLQILSTIR